MRIRPTAPGTHLPRGFRLGLLRICAQTCFMKLASVGVSHGLQFSMSYFFRKLPDVVSLMQFGRPLGAIALDLHSKDNSRIFLQSSRSLATVMTKPQGLSAQGISSTCTGTQNFSIGCTRQYGQLSYFDCLNSPPRVRVP